MTPGDPEMSEARTQAIRELLSERIRNEPDIRRRRLRRRLTIWSSAGLLTVGLASTGAAIIFGAGPVTDQTIVHCLSSTTRGPDGSYPASSATIADKSGLGRVNDALTLCTQMWEQGVLSPSVNPTAPTQDVDGIVVPPLQVCVMRDGTAAVVPSDEASACQALGMASLEE